jgi:6-phosphogluconolactonase
MFSSLSPTRQVRAAEWPGRGANPAENQEVRQVKALHRTFVALLAVAGAAVASAGGAFAAPTAGHVYVNDNTAGTNTVAAFDRNADGSLTEIPGSPFATRGAGTGHAIGSQGALQRTADGRYLLAVDAGSNQVSVLKIKPDGRLQTVGAVSSGGIEPVSIAVHDDLVYVANAGDGGSNYTGFTINAGGDLRPLAGSTVALPDGSQPGDVFFNGTGTILAGTRVNTSLIDSFVVGRDGRLTAAPGSPFAAQGVGPFGSEFRPTDPSQLFVSNAHNGGNAGTVSAFSVAGDGVLSSIGTSPYPDLQPAPCWIEISHDGNYLFAVNTAGPSISRYSIAASGALTLIGSTPFANPVGVGPEDARLAPDGQNLFVVDAAADALSGFAVAGGDLTELPARTPLPAGATPFGIVVT